MRSIDDNTPVTLATLRKLREWGPLPESDISRMVKGFMIVTDDLREMAEEGYIELAFIGDEYVATLATLGRLFIEQQEAREN
jgi:cyclophilin family peptidyl-prolyl cis-trans isomerase